MSFCLNRKFSLQNRYLAINVPSKSLLSVRGIKGRVSSKKKFCAENLKKIEKKQYFIRTQNLFRHSNYSNGEAKGESPALFVIRSMVMILNVNNKKIKLLL